MNHRKQLCLRFRAPLRRWPRPTHCRYPRRPSIPRRLPRPRRRCFRPMSVRRAPRCPPTTPRLHFPLLPLLGRPTADFDRKHCRRRTPRVPARRPLAARSSMLVRDVGYCALAAAGAQPATDLDRRVETPSSFITVAATEQPGWHFPATSPGPTRSTGGAHPRPVWNRSEVGQGKVWYR